MNFSRRSLLIGLVLCQSLLANPVLDLLEGRTDGRELFPFFEEQEAAPKPIAEEDLKKKRKYVPTKYPERSVPETTVYRNDRNGIIQEVAVEGLIQQGFTNGSVTEGSEDTEVLDLNHSEIRRAYLGLAMHSLYFLDTEARFAFDDHGYQGIDRLKFTADLTAPTIPLHNTLQRGVRGIYSLAGFLLSPLKLLGDEDASFFPNYSVNPVEAARLSIGKFQPRFSSQSTLDPTLRLTPDTPELLKQIAPGNTLGVSYEEFNDHWNWRAGWFSGDLDENLPSLNGSGLIQFGLGYNFGMVEVGEVTPYSEFQEVRFDYVHNGDGKNSESILGSYDNLFAVSFLSQNRVASLAADFMLANGEDSSVWGANVTGGFWVVRDFLRLVGQYQHAHSTDENGVRIGFGMTGAQSDVTHSALTNDLFLTGNEYHSFYAGLNFHLFSNRFILGTGVEYQILKSDSATGGEYDSWTWQGNGLLSF